MPKKLFETSDPICPPSWIILFFILLASAVLLLNIPEQITAAIGLVFFLLLVFLHPVNGISAMVLSVPFFLGAAHNPYFFLFEILVYGTLILGFFRLWKEKRPLVIPFKPLVLLLFLAVLFSIPINAKEYYWEFWATPAKEVWFQWLRGHEKFPLIHLRALTNIISGILLFVLVANLYLKNTFEGLEIIIRSMIWMAVLICGIGVLFLFEVIPSHPKSYLSLSLAGTHEGAVSALAFNRQYLAQYLLILFPWVFYLLVTRRRNLSGLILYGLVFCLFIFSLSASMQRSAFLVLFLEIMLLLGFLAKYFSKDKKKALYFFLIPFLILAAMFLVDFLFLEKRFISRFLLLGFSEPDHRRFHLWNTAWSMFHHSPFLGVGLGKFSEFFPEFFSDPRLEWITFAPFRGEPHSFFFQTLAERGAFGLLLIMTLVLAVLARMMKKFNHEPLLEHKLLVGVLAVSLISWLILGFFNNVAYVRSLGVFFWILLGWAVGLTFPLESSEKNRMKALSLYFGLVILLAAFGYQLKLICSRPVDPFFQTGLYAAEVLPGGEKIRWTGKRAVINIDVHEGKKELAISAPLPGVTDHPQIVRFWMGGKLKEVILNNSGWHRISLSAEKPITEKMLLKIETDHTFNPKKAKVSMDDRDLGIMIRED